MGGSKRKIRIITSITIIIMIIIPILYLSNYYFSGSQGKLKLEITEINPIIINNNTSIEMNIEFELKNVGDTWIRIAPFPGELNIWIFFPNGSGPESLPCTTQISELCHNSDGARILQNSDLIVLAPNAKIIYHYEQIHVFTIIGIYKLLGHYDSYNGNSLTLPFWEGDVESNQVMLEVRA